MTQQEKTNQLNEIAVQIYNKKMELESSNADILAALDVLFDLQDFGLAMKTDEGIKAHEAAVKRSVLRMEIDALNKQADMLKNATVK